MSNKTEYAIFIVDHNEDKISTSSINTLKDIISKKNNIVIDSYLNIDDPIQIINKNYPHFCIMYISPDFFQDTSAADISRGKFEILSKKFPNNCIELSHQNNETVDKVANRIFWKLTNEGTNYPVDDNVFFTSDTHFYHERIISLANRPFANVDEMNDKLIENWNSVVGKDDTIWHLGDLCFGNWEKTLSIIPKLNGRINLVLGNHDRRNKIREYYDLGINRVYDRPTLIGDYYILSHHPITTPMGGVFVNIFGHVHNSDMFKTISKCGVCVCTERWNYTPVNFKTIVDNLKKINYGDEEFVDE